MCRYLHGFAREVETTPALGGAAMHDARLRQATGLRRWTRFVDHIPDAFIDVLSGRDERPPLCPERDEHDPPLPPPHERDER